MRVFANTNCLVTGGAGFIGSALVGELIRQGARVTVVDNFDQATGANAANLEPFKGKFTLVNSSIGIESSVLYSVEASDYIFNLAGKSSHIDSMTEPLADCSSNSVEHLRLLEMVKKVGSRPRIVFASTRQIYGRPLWLPVDELHPLAAVDVNGINKISGESFHRLYGELYGLHVVCLRLTNTFGPRMRLRDAKQTFLGTWIKAALLGEDFQVFGDGTQRRDFNYVDDVVRALLLAVQDDSARGQTFNLGGNEVVNLAAVAEMIKELAPKSNFQLVPFPPERRQIDIGDYFGDWSKVQRTIGWEPQVSLRDGLRRTFDFFSDSKFENWTA